MMQARAGSVTGRSDGMAQADGLLHQCHSERRLPYTRTEARHSLQQCRPFPPSLPCPIAVDRGLYRDCLGAPAGVCHGIYGSVSIGLGCSKLLAFAADSARPDSSRWSKRVAPQWSLASNQANGVYLLANQGTHFGNCIDPIKYCR